MRGPRGYDRAKKLVGRKRVALVDAEIPRAALDCVIKGNISRSGEKVYHLPGTRDYARTIIDEASDERMFCSEDEAKAAGWRAEGLSE